MTLGSYGSKNDTDKQRYNMNLNATAFIILNAEIYYPDIFRQWCASKYMAAV